MSKKALEKYADARTTQLQTNEARKMRALIKQARGNIQRSGSRWPFELTQNAHDPGPRSEGGQINITLVHDQQQVVFGHDGKPFSTGDLAALLSGGSSKDFDSQETTGRFGTGFLLTHVLSREVEVQGVLDLDGSYERFSIYLDRSGDEDDIFKNITKCNESIENAEILGDIGSEETARFTYRLDSIDAADLGVKAFIATLPFLYATCPHLGSVTIISEGKTLAFNSPGAAVERGLGGIQFTERDVLISEDELEPRTIRSMLVRKQRDSPSGLVVVLERIHESWAVVEIPPELPRIFVRFPIRSSEFLPVNVVIDGRLDLSQERDSVLMEVADRAQISEALELLPELLTASLEEKWERGFTLARVGMPTQQFGDPLGESDKVWWNNTLKSVANRLSMMPLVQTNDGAFHKVHIEESYADFITQRLNRTDPLDDTALDFEEVWQSASDTKSALPPALDIARRWTEITAEWLDLGVVSERLGLAGIAELARSPSGKLADLQTKTQPLDWLVRFLNMVGKLDKHHNYTSTLKELLPNQNEILKSPSCLWRDDGIDEQLKDIGDSLGLGIRDRLLSNDVASQANLPAFNYLKILLEAEIPRSLTTEMVLGECISELSKQLPDLKEITPDSLVPRRASIDLLWLLWRKQGTGAAELARQCPLISSEGTSIRWTSQRRVMAPALYWHQDAQPFANVYKADRVLAEDYLTQSDDGFGLVDALCIWEIAYAGPLFEDTVKELRERKLEILSLGKTSSNVVVKDVKVTRIAFLNSELIQRCHADQEVARSLLGLVVCFAARHDRHWEETKAVIGRSGEEEVSLLIRSAMWVADLRSRAWVPVNGEQGLAPVFADAGNLIQLLDPVWLENNGPGIRLLCQFFGFKQLDLQLLVNAPTDELRIELESGLARIVQTLGSDASAYGELAATVEAKKRRDQEKERNRKFGLAVQDAISRCLAANGLDLVLIDCGYDYDVYLEGAESVEAGTHHLQMADYLLEVKATTTGDVRLTPAQARTASESNAQFILCVVDLRGITPERMGADWNVEDVDSRAKIFRNIGMLTQQPSGLVDEARQCSVGIRNDNALRYGVPAAIWEKGLSISEWIAQLPVRSPILQTDVVVAEADVSI